MKDFQLRNDTKLLMRNDPTPDLKELTNDKSVLFVYGKGSVKRYILLIFEVLKCQK